MANITNITLDNKPFVITGGGEGAINITANGTYDVTSKASAVVNVPSGIDMGTWELIANSVDADGNPYNGGLGYKDNYRLNSSGVETVGGGYFCTGFIPCSEYKQISAYIEPTNNAAIVSYIARYNSSKSFLGIHAGTGYVSAITGTANFVRVSFYKPTSSALPTSTNAKIKIVT